MTLVSDAKAIATVGIRAADPKASVKATLTWRGRRLHVGGLPWPGAPGDTVHVLAIGKAAASMIDGAVERLGRSFAVGLAVLREGTRRPRCRVEVVRGEHPIPGAGSFRAGRRVLDFARRVPPEGRLLVLLSGGGSAIAEVPPRSLTFSDISTTTRLLLGSGAPIGALNTVRRHLSLLKGGGLLRVAGPRRVVTLAISDVVGDRKEDVASGPTVADPTTFDDARRVLRRYVLWDHLNTRVCEYLDRGARHLEPETLKPGDPRLRPTRYQFVATNRKALQAAAGKARELGYRTYVESSHITGEVRVVAQREVQRFLRRAAHHGSRLAALFGGETTVTLGPRSGRGGRNQEYALTAVPLIDGRRSICVLSMGTDGIDGPTDAAGGVVTGATASLARRRGVDVDGASRRHSSYDALRRLGALIQTGPTGTNVMDVQVFLAERRAGTE